MTKSIQISILILLGCLYHAIAQESEHQDHDTAITIDISGVSSDKGKLFIALYSDEKDWLKSTDYSTKSLVRNGKANVTFESIPDGEYAISIFHDENDNGEMDSNWLGIPKEAFACSNGALGKFGPPKWSDAVFTVSGSNLTQLIKF